MRINNYIVLSLLVSFGLTACADRVGLAEQKMQEIRNQPAQPIQPLPQPQVVQAFNYSAGQLRSPFMPPSLMLRATQEAEIQGVRPDETRIKEPLEQFDLNELTYRGIVVSENGELYALIQTPEGRIASVKVGNYLGKNYGRITEITPTQINLIEIVPDSRVGFIEQPTSIAVTASYD